jgi:putative oxygen-independent coproporphyrinogen III oxidase
MAPQYKHRAMPHADTLVAARAAANWRDPGFGIYVHWPFCAHKCPYCDFNSHVRAGVDHDRWRAALLTELAHFAALTPGRTVTSIFFGGGTPSLMAPSTAAAVVEAVAQHWSLAPDAEITLEANPTSVEAAKFEAFAAGGVNRVSLGVQALNARDLGMLGRQHTAEEALAAVRLARRYFGRVSFDLIYARPEQTVAAWEAELRHALDEGLDHLSAYQLTIEAGTRFHTLHQRGELVVPDEELAGDLYEATQAVMAGAGLPAYEVSNHARPGEESRHNLTYWRYGDYVGVGPGAHGRLTLGDGSKAGTQTHRAPEIWLEQVEAHGHAAKPFQTITAEEQASEYLMMGLRMAEGVEIARLEALAAAPLDAIIERGVYGQLLAEGLADDVPGLLQLSADGRQRLDAILPRLVR